MSRRMRVTFAALLLAAFPLMAQEKPKPADPPPAAPSTPAATSASARSVLDFTVKDIDNQDVPLRRFEGDVLLIVNVASQCGLTDSNYTQLEPLYQKYKDRGLRVLAFPCNDFGSQEPGSADQIKQFCRDKYKSSYDLFAKVAVKGEQACPLYRYLTGHADERIKGEVTWNFQKYLVGRDGQVLEKFNPRINPGDEKITSAIEKALAAERPRNREAAAPVKGK